MLTDHTLGPHFSHLLYGAGHALSTAVRGLNETRDVETGLKLRKGIAGKSIIMVFSSLDFYGSLQPLHHLLLPCPSSFPLSSVLLSHFLIGPPSLSPFTPCLAWFCTLSSRGPQTAICLGSLRGTEEKCHCSIFNNGAGTTGQLHARDCLTLYTKINVDQR